MQAFSDILNGLSFSRDHLYFLGRLGTRPRVKAIRTITPVAKICESEYPQSLLRAITGSERFRSDCPKSRIWLTLMLASPSLLQNQLDPTRYGTKRTQTKNVSARATVRNNRTLIKG